MFQPWALLGSLDRGEYTLLGHLPPWASVSTLAPVSLLPCWTDSTQQRLSRPWHWPTFLLGLPAPAPALPVVILNVLGIHPPPAHCVQPLS